MLRMGLFLWPLLRIKILEINSSVVLCCPWLLLGVVRLLGIESSKTVSIQSELKCHIVSEIYSRKSFSSKSLYWLRNGSNNKHLCFVYALLSFIFPVLLAITPEASYMLVKGSDPDLQPQPQRHSDLIGLYVLVTSLLRAPKTLAIISGTTKGLVASFSYYLVIDLYLTQHCWMPRYFPGYGDILLFE